MTKTTVIYHRADYDGLFSAAVCAKFLPKDTTFIGWDFGDPLVAFPIEGSVYIVDLSPDCLESLPHDAGSRLTWIDHHKSSIEKWDHQLGSPFKGYLIDGVAACRLCWQWFMNDYQKHGLGWALPKLGDYQYRSVEEPLALTLAGEYDVWDLARRAHFTFSVRLNAGKYMFNDGLDLMLDKPTELDITGKWIFPGDVDTYAIVKSGQDALAWQKSLLPRSAKNVLTYANGRVEPSASWHRATPAIPLWFPQDAIPKECDALMCWRYDGKQVSFSLYHAPGHEQCDLSQIAVKYGGGGHRGACGFQLSLDQALELIR